MSSYEIYVIDLQEMDLTRLTYNNYRDATPSWSSDCSRIVYMMQIGSNYDIYMMQSDGTGIQRLTTNAARDGFPQFSPDDSRIIFQTTRYVWNYQLALLDLNTGEISRITYSNQSDEAPTWSPDGRFILYDSQNYSLGTRSLYALDFETQQPIQLTHTSANDQFVDWGSIKTCTFGPAESINVIRCKGQPVAESFEWDSCGGDGSMLIESDSLSSAWVYLNGELILEPSMVNQNVTNLEIPASLIEGENDLEVQLAGAPGSQATIEFHITE